MDFKNMGSDPGKSQAAPSTPLPLSLSRQLSIYSLTFDEFQNTLGGPGKDFGSMNMDEFLKNIWTAEESQAMASALGGPAPDANAAASTSFGLQRQGSLTLPRTLSQKTVDEVWKDLLKESGPGQSSSGSGGGGTPELPPQQRQPTLGEMTLEEFLVRAGVVREDMNPQPQPIQRPVGNSIFGELPSMNNINSNNNNNNNHGIGLGLSQTLVRNTGGVVSNLAPRPYPNVGIGDLPGMSNGLMSSVVGLGGGGGVAVGGVGSPDGIGKGNGDLSSLSPVPLPYNVFGSGMRGRKCGAVEKVVERRQRRMIKNRESAARSRERKQAYTMELEAEVAKLKEQNEELLEKQEEIMEIQKNQVMELINQQSGPKKLCLQRTQTGPW